MLHSVFVGVCFGDFAALHPLLDQGPLVGTLLMRILDHFVLGLGCGMRVLEGSMSILLREVLMWGAASWREWGDADGPPVTTRLPFAVHPAAIGSTCP